MEYCLQIKSGNEKRKRNGVAVCYGKQQEHRNSKKYYGRNGGRNGIKRVFFKSGQGKENNKG